MRRASSRVALRVKRAGDKARAARETENNAPASLDRCFLAVLCADFLHNGAAAIARVREDDPLGYLKLCAAMVPKTAGDAVDPLEHMGDDELVEQARHIAAQIGLALASDPARAARKDEA